jgi:hypothetical protein
MPNEYEAPWAIIGKQGVTLWIAVYIENETRKIYFFLFTNLAEISCFYKIYIAKRLECWVRFKMGTEIGQINIVFNGGFE